MCGIAGWVDWQRDLRQDKEMAVIERMTAALISRGPDDQGIWAAEHVLLGHRRLVVLDPLGQGSHEYGLRAGGAGAL